MRLTTWWMSVSVATVALAQAPNSRVFDYDQHAPLEIEVVSSKTDGAITIRDVTFASPRGGRVPAWIVEPLGEGPFGAILFMHMGGGDRDEFLAEAAAQARRGMVSILIQAPHLRPDPPESLKDDERPRAESDLDFYTTLVIDLRRAIDVLVERPEVDPGRIGYVGHSLGATWGSALAGFERRIEAFVLVAGTSYPERISGNDWYSRIMQSVVGEEPDQIQHYEDLIGTISPRQYLPHAVPGSILLQFGLNDEKVPPDTAEEMIAVAGPSHEVRWYQTDHDFENARATEERIEWLSRKLSP